MLYAADADKNGNVNPQEFATFLYYADLNRDGTLSDEEYNSMIS